MKKPKAYKRSIEKCPICSGKMTGYGWVKRTVVYTQGKKGLSFEELDDPKYSGIIEYRCQKCADKYKNNQWDRMTKRKISEKRKGRS